jgi:CHAD domain-containing protein
VNGHPRDIAETVRGAIARSYDRLVEHESGVLEGSDPEAIHQARVATRRLRSDLRTFEPFLDKEFAASLRGELRWLGAELGAVRDAEVMRDRLRAHAATLAPGESDAVRYVLRRIDADREAARNTLLASMRTARYAQLKVALCEAARRPKFSGDTQASPKRALRTVVTRRWKTLRRAVDKLGPMPSDDALHGIRMRAKRCRYAAEACEPVFGKPARRFARALADLQDTLGEQHDAVVAIAWLEKTAPECTPGEAFALGRLAQFEFGESDRARQEFRGVWRQARRKQLREWL